MTNPLHQLRALGQSVWLDALSRSFLTGGYLGDLIDAGEVDGLTSNPTIFHRALASDPAYDQVFAELRGAEPRQALWEIITRDVRDACDLFLPMYRDSDGRSGFVSMELDPADAFDTERTVAEGLALYEQLKRPNLMVKVPGTEPAVPAITRLTAEGVNVNVTLLFSVARYEAVARAYLDGLRIRADRGEPLDGISSVASFFVSRVDTKVDKLLGEEHPDVVTAGIANARVAYGAFQRIAREPEASALTEQGARMQRPLWASTSTKNPIAADVLYVRELAGPDTVNTLPSETLEAFRDHGGAVEDRLSGTAGEAERQLHRLEEAGVDLGQLTKELEAEGVDAFARSLESAVATVAERIA